MQRFTALVTFTVLVLGFLAVDQMRRAEGGGATPAPIGNGDVNGDGSRDISDALYLLNWLFGGGPAPAACAAPDDLAGRVATLESNFNLLRDDVRSLQTMVADLDARVRAIKGGGGLTPEERAVLSHLSVDPDTETLLVEGIVDGSTIETVRFKGVNVQIVNGRGATNGNPIAPDAEDPNDIRVNGLGNLIVGYNETGSDLGDDRSGSHNIVVGFRNSYTSVGTLVVGRGNRTEGAYSAVSGGQGNRTTDVAAAVSGGFRNTASGWRSSVSGGRDNFASGDYASVSGGMENRATGTHTSVSGGQANEAAAGRSWVGGGSGNTAGDPSDRNRAKYSVVSGGQGNRATGEWSSVHGGQVNEASGRKATVSGGSGNVSSGDHAAASGGNNNVASGTFTSVVGGANATVGNNYVTRAGDLRATVIRILGQ